jgi:hypothetical protein
MKRTGERIDTVTFHEHGREYFWCIPSGVVTNRQNQVVATGCHNLNMAREKARGQHK